MSGTPGSDVEDSGSISDFNVLTSDVLVFGTGSGATGNSTPSSAESWELAERPSSGPSDTSPPCTSPGPDEGELLAASAPSAEEAVSELNGHEEEEACSDVTEESEPDEAWDSDFDCGHGSTPDLDFLSSRSRSSTIGPHGGDIRKRARQARRHVAKGLFHGSEAKGKKFDHVYRVHMERIGRAETARDRRADTLYRVEERRFKRRFRDWCCFGGWRPTATARVRYPMPTAPPLVPAVWRAPPRVPAAVVATPTEAVAKKPAEAQLLVAKLSAAEAIGRGFMQAYARAAYFRTLGLLQKSYVHKCSVDVSRMKKWAANGLRRAVQRALATPPSSCRRRRALTRTRLRKSWRHRVDWDDMTLERKSRGCRAMKRRAWHQSWKQAQRRKMISKVRLEEGRRELSKARSKCRSAERDAKYSEDAPLREPSPSSVLLPPKRRPRTSWRASGLPLVRRAVRDANPIDSPHADVELTETVEWEAMARWRPSATAVDEERLEVTHGHASASNTLACAEESLKSSDAHDNERLVMPSLAEGVSVAEAALAHVSEKDSPSDETGGEDDMSGLVSVWEQLEQFEFTKPSSTDGKVLVPAKKTSKPYTVAVQGLFLSRFHLRTGGVLRDIDWTNLCAIGGMMLACLVADDEEFKESYAETDVDIYIIGLSGEAFKERVARLVEEVYSAAVRMGMQVVVLRTPCTITLSLRTFEPLPNVQIVMSPFSSTGHLLRTTDIDCTGFGFNGERLLCTNWAREAVAHRRVLARPEKYGIRGEWSTESRLLKYAMRGFNVVDCGLHPETELPSNEAVEAIAAQASVALLDKACDESTDGPSMDAIARKFERAVCATGVNGANLLLLAQRYPGLRELLLFDVPLLPAGMANDRLLSMLRTCDARWKQDGYERSRPKNPLVGRCKLRVLFDEVPFVKSASGRPSSLYEAVVGAVEIRDPDAASEVRSWYNGLDELRQVTDGTGSL